MCRATHHSLQNATLLEVNQPTRRDPMSFNSRLKKSFDKKLKRFLTKWDLGLTTIPQGDDLFADLHGLVKVDSPLCLDVGANIGQTIENLRRVFKTPMIHAFEPSAEVFELLREKVQAPGVELHRMALGSEAGEKEFINNENSCLGSFLPMDQGQENKLRRFRETAAEVVTVETVDGFLQSCDIDKVDVLKVDAQGFDLEVLKGAGQLLGEKRAGVVIAEINFVKMYENQAGASEISDWLAERGYHLVDYYEKNRTGATLSWVTAMFTLRPDLDALDQ